MTQLFKQIRQKGYLMVGYTLLKALGCTNVIILERLLTEYQHAIRHKFMFASSFIIDLEIISMHTGVSEEMVFEALLEFRDLGFIDLWNIKEKALLCKINEEEIVNFEKNIEQENSCKRWNYGLYSTQAIIYDFKEE